MPFRPLLYLKNIGLTFDIGLNVLLAGSPTETLSSRLGRWRTHKSRAKRWIAKPICAGLDIIDPNHCEKVRQHERELGLHRPESLDDEPRD